MSGPPSGRGGRLLRKYVTLFAAVVCTALLGYGAVDAWFAYRDQTAALLRIQTEQAETAAARIEQFIRGIEGQIGWTTQLPWNGSTLEQHRFDALRLLRQVPAITDFAQIDAGGLEQLRLSRLAMDVIGSRIDMTKDLRFSEAREKKVYYGPVTFRRDSEPYMTIALAGPRRDAVVSVAEVNLKFILDVVSRIKVGAQGLAYVVDDKGRLVAHPDISLVLRNTDLAGLPQVRAAREGMRGGDPVASRTMFAQDIDGRHVLSASASIAPTGWMMFVELPVQEAYAPLYASFWRTAVLLVVGLALSGLAGYLLARRMVVPIRVLQEGAARIGAGDLDHRVEVRTGDELESLADQFNSMTGELRASQERESRMSRLRRFLSPQLAGLFESSGGEALLESHRREVSVVFCDLRGFTAFAEAATPEAVMTVLREYHAALGALIHKYEGTLERFVGDGVLVLFNDPLPCPEPEARAIRMAAEMRSAVAALAEQWKVAGHTLGFGIGIAHGVATMGRIGFEGRFDYSAIGSVVNLAARLCNEAKDGQILVDAPVRDAAAAIAEVEPVGELALKGFRKPVATFNVRSVKPA